ncbi:DUF397 domain-containing protein [Streptomyces acidiscabies]|uniref:Toxin n=1 Tax=Streptomyces acidiscabies TaxID=42234 RepID=A0A0L0KF18_9ACTN|nr:DUF397 domain-containing protein [Streptomyces acidiscabies]KND36752.1 toxin [Streptomyces acidiscabies]
MIRKSAAGDSSELAWFKSSFSDSSNPEDCVEVANTPSKIYIRDTKHRDSSPRLAVTPATWTGFLAYASR